MSDTSHDDKSYRQRVTKAKAAVWLATRASRNTGIVDRLCRRALARLATRSPEQDFMQDDLVDADKDFDPEKLARYQRGESS